MSKVTTLSNDPEFRRLVEAGTRPIDLKAQYGSHSPGTVQRARDTVLIELNDKQKAVDDFLAPAVGLDAVVTQGTFVLDAEPEPDNLMADAVESAGRLAPAHQDVAGFFERGIEILRADDVEAAPSTVMPEPVLTEAALESIVVGSHDTIVLADEIDQTLLHRIGSAVDRLDVDHYADDLIRSLADLPDNPAGDQMVVDVAMAARQAGDALWRVQCCCAYVIQHRVAKRLTGGRGKADVEQEGVTAQLARFAAQIGVESVRTIQKDAKVHEVFFLEAGDEDSVPSTPLSKTFHTIALTAPDPKSAIEYAQQQVETDPRFNCQQFRHYIATLKEGKTSQQAENDYVFLSVRLPKDVGAKLSRLRTLLNCDNNTAIAYGLQCGFDMKGIE